MDVDKLGKIAVFDIETTDFKADFGYMITWAAKFVGDSTTYYDRIDDNEEYGTTPKSMMDDGGIVASLIDFLTGADALVGHYASGFDLKFLNTRALDNGLDPLQPIAMIDTWRIMKDYLALTRNSLKNGAAFLNDDSAQKGGLSKSQWKLAYHGHRPTMDKMVEYNIADVVATEGVYLKMMPLIRNHPFVGSKAVTFDDSDRSYVCPRCGSAHIQRRGIRRTQCFAIRRLHCQNCGGWPDGKRSKVA